nr:tetratricopeptide repeat protein [Pseudomonas aeruginosa]
MNRLRACLLSSALLSASSAQALGLLDAYQLAVRHDPTFQAALHERRAGSENRAIGRAGLLPSLRYDYNKARNDSTVSQGDARVERDYRSYASTLSLEQPLFDYEAYARYRQGEAQALFAEGRIGDAEATLKALLAENNENAAALILYARCLAERGELEEAQAILDAVKSDEHKQALAGARAQLTFLRQAADLPDSAELKSRLAADAGDDEAAYQLAVQQLARQQYEAALDGLLKLFLRNRGYQDDLPRKTLVQVFDLLGNDHPLVTAYRRKLYQALY